MIGFQFPPLPGLGVEVRVADKLAAAGTATVTPQDIQDAILTGAGCDPDFDVNGNGVVDVADVVAASQ